MRLAPRSALIRAWAPAVVWAGFISILSTDLMSGDNTGRFLDGLLQALGFGIDPVTTARLNFVTRKLAHVGEYLILALALDRGFRAEAVRIAGPRWIPLCVVAVAVLFSLADEAHQAWRPARTGSLIDCGFDGIGAALGAWIAARWGNPFAVRGQASRAGG